MTTDFLSARTFLRRQFPNGGNILCAVSGGLDSMCLLAFMAEQPGFTVAAAHFHHGLRGDTADRDLHFVQDYCRAHHIPCFTGRGDTRRLAEETGQTVEEAARTLRYEFLQKTAADGGFDAIFTAHHADDNAETVLLNLLRGTGSAGLAGIPQRRGNICRPFLQLTRNQLEQYAAMWNLPHVEDETNELEDAARNVLRHRVLPVLKELNPCAVENIGRTARILSGENQVLEDAAIELTSQMVCREEEVSISCTTLLSAPRSIAERAALQLLTAAAGHRKDLTAAHVEALLELAETVSPTNRISLPYGLTARREGDTLRIEKNEILATVPLLPDRPVCWGDYTLTLLDHPAGEGIAIRPGEERLTVCPCAPSQRLYLPEGRGARSVKRLCIDQKIPLNERDRLPSIYADGRLAAVWKLGVTMEFIPQDTACRFIQIKKREKGDQS